MELLEESQSHHNQTAVLVRLVQEVSSKKAQRGTQLSNQKTKAICPSGHLVLSIHLPPSE
ncbi:hypothetical protein I79_014833 [Cricetulus griseus]|uniref:Uncharacterized protein n=1 Tax=Cricetulus griseus TaxID=10029 RepID=G3HV57_CRIGR|nr:hypothetical protein I79_014833 [Cricetulus griseus]